MTATAIARFEDAERHFDNALRENRRLGFGPWLAWTRYQYAQIHLTRNAAGDRERAAQRLTAAELAGEHALDGLGQRIAACRHTVRESAAANRSRHLVDRHPAQAGRPAGGSSHASTASCDVMRPPTTSRNATPTTLVPSG